MRKYTLFIIISIALLSCGKEDVISEETKLERPIITLEMMEDTCSTRSLSDEGNGWFSIYVYAPHMFQVSVSGPGISINSGDQSGNYYKRFKASGYGLITVRVSCENGCCNYSETYVYNQNGIGPGTAVDSKWNRCNHSSQPFSCAMMENHYVVHEYGNPVVTFKLYIPCYNGPILMEVQEIGFYELDLKSRERYRPTGNSNSISRYSFYHTSSSSYYEVNMRIPNYSSTTGNNRYLVRM